MSASVIGDLHPSDLGRASLVASVIAATGASAASRPGTSLRFAAPAGFVELMASCALIQTTEAAFSPFVLSAASPLVMAAMLNRRSLIGLSLVATAAVFAATLTGPARGIPLSIHATAVVLALPWVVALGRTFMPAQRDVYSRSLSGADQSLIEMLGSGLTYAQAAERLDVSTETVKVRIAKLYRRLGARNRQEALRLASRMEGGPTRGTDVESADMGVTSKWPERDIRGVKRS